MFLVQITPTEFVEYWLSHSELWFNSTPETDQHLSQWKYLLDQQDDCFDMVIIYDQLARHVYRNHADKVVGYHTKALKIVESNIDTWLTQLPTNRLVWALLTIRHSAIGKPTDQSISIIQRCIDMLPQTNSWDSHITRFYKASVIRLSELYNKLVTIDPPYLVTSFQQYKDITDYCPVDMTTGHANLSGFDYSCIDKGVKCLIISLSGGVDSMVASHMLNRWCSDRNITLIAVHINYCNRETADREEAFVRDWCGYLGINIVVRRITEINRTRDFLRDFYEKHTRDIRFITYNIAYEMAMRIRSSTAYVIMGHNSDDTLENIFANIAKHRDLHNLRGMSIRTNLETEKVTLLRPMLKIPKSAIICFARENNIPYLYDSTPNWSERGKMRDKLIPYIKDFNPAILTGLQWLTDNLTDLSQYIESTYSCYRKSFVKESHRVYTNNINHLLPMTFWQVQLMDICKHLQIPYVSHRSTTEFIKMLRKWNGDVYINKHNNSLFYIYDFSKDLRAVYWYKKDLLEFHVKKCLYK